MESDFHLGSRVHTGLRAEDRNRNNRQKAPMTKSRDLRQTSHEDVADALFADESTNDGHVNTPVLSLTASLKIFHANSYM